MTNFLVTTADDEIAEDTDLQNQTNDGNGLSLREAIQVANASAGADTILFDPSLLGQTLDMSSNNGIIITEDLTLSSGVDVVHNFANVLFQINGDTTLVNELNIFKDTTDSAPFLSAIEAIRISGPNSTFTNLGTITTNGFGDADNDRTPSIQVNEAFATINNGVDASIISQGRFAINSFGFDDSGAYIPDFLTVNNDGLLQGTDDTVRLGLGTINNAGTIRTTGEFDLGGIFAVPGLSADAIAVVNFLDSSFVPGADGLLVVNNSATGLIEGHRSGIQMFGGGTVNNDGVITAEVTGILSGGNDDFSNIFVLNNTGTISAGSEDFGLNDPELRGSISLFAGLDSAEITNSGTIDSGFYGIYAFAGANVTNTAPGEIIADTDGTGDDAIAFYGSQMDDFRLEAVITSRDLNFADFISAQGVTIDGNGNFVVPGLDGTFGNGFTAILVALVGADLPLIPLVDIEATQQSGFLTFQLDGNGQLLFPETIDIETTLNGLITVEFDSVTGFAIRDANGDPIFNVPDGVDFDDTILNAGLIDGDIVTGLGDDTVINTGTLDGNIILGVGDDFANAGAGNTRVDGGDGNDTIDGGAGDDRLFGDAGRDTLNGGEGADLLRGGDDRDILRGGDDDDRLFGEDGDDIIGGDAGDDTLSGGNGNDTLFGGSGEDIVFGEAGDDVLNGGGRDDLVRGGDGADTLNGDAGNDRLFGDNGADELNGGDGVDTLFGGNDNDTIRGGTGDDRLNGDAGNDILGGDSGDDFVFGGAGNDILVGANGNDRLFGEDGDDNMNGGNGNDFLRAGDGNDILRGGVGDDRLFGDEGDDFLQGGAGEDVMSGGAGADIFAYDLGSGVDAIRDFGFGDDTILVDAALGVSGFDDLQILQRGDNTLIRLEPGGVDSLILFDTDAASLTADDFVFEQPDALNSAIEDITFLDDEISEPFVTVAAAEFEPDSFADELAASVVDIMFETDDLFI